MPETFHHISRRESDTARFGAALAAAVEPGTVIALVGDLGAGKTRLVRAFAAAMGVDEREVTSPTFVLVQHYAGRLPIHHFDAYRLRDSDEFLELGAEELLEGEGVCLIEWADRVDDVLPTDRLEVRIAVTGERERHVAIRGLGEKSEVVRARLHDSLSPHT